MPTSILFIFRKRLNFIYLNILWFMLVFGGL